MRPTKLSMIGDHTRLIIKHLPPSGASLRLLDVNAAVGAVLAQQRLDLDIDTVHGAVANWQLAPDVFDAVVVYDSAYDETLLRAALDALRPGGRMILIDRKNAAHEQQVNLLESIGYTRILVEALPDQGALLRGEKPHHHERTVDRIRSVANTGPDTRTPYVHLLIRQEPNKPVWALAADDVVTWQAVAIETAEGTRLLGFSSLSKAVAFMQPAVMQDLIRDVNKVGKFSRETANSWSLPVTLNPDLVLLKDAIIAMWTVDPATAEAADE